MTQNWNPKNRTFQNAWDGVHPVSVANRETEASIADGNLGGHIPAESIMSATGTDRTLAYAKPSRKRSPISTINTSQQNSYTKNKMAAAEIRTRNCHSHERIVSAPPRTTIRESPEGGKPESHSHAMLTQHYSLTVTVQQQLPYLIAIHEREAVEQLREPTFCKFSRFRARDKEPIEKERV